MPNLTCTVTKCGHNEDKMCTLNSIDVSGGGSKENTCCNNFTHSESFKNASNSASPATHIYCQAKDCKYNDECVCMAEKIDITPANNGSCEDSKCNTYMKR